LKDLNNVMSSNLNLLIDAIVTVKIYIKDSRWRWRWRTHQYTMQKFI